MGLQSSGRSPSVGSGGASGKGPGFATQEVAGFRQGWPEWMRQLPRLSFPKESNKKYQLIDREKMKAELGSFDPAVIQRIEEDLDYMEHELMRLFRERDFEAKQQQNRYRLVQITYSLLATAATLIGSFQALSLGTNPNAVPALAFLETVVALATTYLATISGREPPLPRWLTNRRRAEDMRRECFRYLMDMPPYDTVAGYERRMLLSKRAADINRGVHPDKQSQ